MNVLGIDVGGTSTRAVLVAADGRCLGYGATGAGNPTSSGTETASAAIVAAASAALERAGLAATSADVRAVVVAIAGGTAPSSVSIAEALAATGVAGEVSFESDVLATYCSGSMAADGYVLIAGTGAVAGRIRDARLDALCDGVGWLLGDDGSGFWIGRRVVRSVAAALDGRGPATALTRMVLDALGIDDASERRHGGRLDSQRRLVEAVYRLRPVALSRFAQLAFAASADGDAPAQRIVDDAADALATTIAAVIDPEVAGPVVLGGSILAQQPAIAERVVAAVRAAGVIGDVSTVGDGTVGAAVLALRHAGAAVDPDVFDRIASSLAALR
jgi:glucosamine kinase